MKRQKIKEASKLEEETKRKYVFGIVSRVLHLDFSQKTTLQTGLVVIKNRI